MQLSFRRPWCLGTLSGDMGNEDQLFKVTQSIKNGGCGTNFPEFNVQWIIREWKCRFLQLEKILVCFDSPLSQIHLTLRPILLVLILVKNLRK